MAKNTATYTIITIAALIFAAIFFHATATRNTSKIETTLQALPSTIDWGILAPNQQAKQTVTLTNTAAEPTNHLSMTANPTVGTLTWNQEGNVIPTGANLTCTFTLTVSANPPQGPFNFNITVSG